MSIYLDNAATTKPCREAVKAVTDCMTENYGNPSSLHTKGLNAQLAVDNVRKIIARAIAADPACIYFTSVCSGSADYSKIIAFSSTGCKINTCRCY